ELVGVAHEEYRRVVADHVPVAFPRVEFDGKASYVALGVCCAALAGNGREAKKDICLLADLREDVGAGIARDVVRHRKGAEGSRTLGMHDSLGNPFTVEVSMLFEQLMILHQQRTTGSG